MISNNRMLNGHCRSVYSSVLKENLFCHHETFRTVPLKPCPSLKVIATFSDTREESSSERVFHCVLELELRHLTNLKVHLVPEIFQCCKAETPHPGLDVIEEEEVQQG